MTQKAALRTLVLDNFPQVKGMGPAPVPSDLVEPKSYPYITLNRIYGKFVETHDGPSIEHTIFQFNCWSPYDCDADDLRDAIRDFFIAPYSGEAGSLLIDSCNHQVDSEFFDA